MYPATFDYFYKQKNTNKLGEVFYTLKAWCKNCDAKKSREWSIKNHEKTLEYKRKHNSLEYRKLSNREISKQQRLDGKHKKYQQEHPEKMRDYTYKRQNKNHKISKKEWEDCKVYFNNSCAYCGIHEDIAKTEQGNSLHKEHVIHDGNIDLSNCVPACKSCNSKKWKFNMEEWFKEQDFFTEERLHKIIKWIQKDYMQYIKQ